ncbi:hypothetical protein [Curtobacterium oceanosedimentum]|uniref:hypothetical protein n=1 Tax=Curtobacterium oceanosedimentum TaxID=465820 RepID=UPI001CE067E2|nr:hypothetical protein [Curtobacterium oceanosedimentum]MCA5922799.1 hypothetical protein [Curtobacterium oceanosedimentum]
MTIRSGHRIRPWIIDVVAAAACLGIAWWRLQSSPEDINVSAAIVVGAVALGYGGVVGCWSKLSDRRPAVLAVLMVVVILVFIGLVGAARPIAGLQWLWLLTTFAGLISGAAIGDRVSMRRRGTTQPRTER